MKHLIAIIAVCLCQAFVAEAVTIGGSVGRKGEPYVTNGITWQNVYLEGTKFKVTASIPGSPRSVLMNGNFKVESNYQDTYYWVETKGADDQRPPKSYEDLVKLFTNEKGNFHPLKNQMPKVRFAAEYTYTRNDGVPGVTHILVSKRKMYIIGAVGKDLSLLKPFFESFNIVKED